MPESNFMPSKTKEKILLAFKNVKYVVDRNSSRIILNI